MNRFEDDYKRQVNKILKLVINNLQKVTICWWLSANYQIKPMTDLIQTTVTRIKFDLNVNFFKILL